MVRSPFHSSQLEVICGPMMCGKSAELIAHLDRFDHTDYMYQVFKPHRDTRGGPFVVTRRGNLRIPAPFIDSADPTTFLSQLSAETRVVAFDESQFLAPAYLPVMESLRREGRYLLVAGLDLDFRGEGFGIMPELMGRANTVIKLTAVCKHVNEQGSKCQAEATHSIRLIDGKPAPYKAPVIQVGDEEYSPRCIEHHIVPGRPA